MAALIAASFLAACSGAGGNVSSPALPATGSPGSHAAPNAVAVTFSIAVPQARSTAARPAYVSAATQSASISVAQNGGSPGTPVTVNCTTTCTGTIEAPIGSDTFSMSLYDNTNATGNLLSTGSVTQTINAGTANSVNVTFNGVVKSLAVSLSGPLTYGSSGSVNVTVHALDADGNTIVGPGSYVNASGNPLAIALADSDGSGSTSLSATSLTAPSSTPVTLSYKGGALTSVPTITASATGLTQASAAAQIRETFSATGSLQSFVVPTGVTSVTIDANGAGGGGGNGVGGTGASLTGTYAVTPGDTLAVIVGKGGIGTAAAGAGGGGGSFVYDSTTSTLLIAAGGGGGGSSLGNATSEAATTTTNGGNGGNNGFGGNAGNGGLATGTAGAGGGVVTAGANATLNSSTALGGGVTTATGGGAGGAADGTINAGGYGGGGGGGSSTAGGGGGGYSGGGGGGYDSGGGGGASFSVGTASSNGPGGAGGATGASGTDGTVTIVW